MLAASASAKRRGGNGEPGRGNSDYSGDPDEVLGHSLTTIDR